MDINNEEEIYVHLSAIVNKVRPAWLEFEEPKNMDSFIKKVLKYFKEVQKRFNTHYTLNIYRKKRARRPELVLFSVLDIEKYGNIWSEETLSKILNLGCFDKNKKNDIDFVTFDLICNNESIITSVCRKGPQADDTYLRFQYMRDHFRDILPEFSFSISIKRS